MDFFIRMIIGLIGCGAGFLLIKYTHQIYNVFGAMDFAEKYLRFFGGTRIFIKLVGLVIILLSFLYIFSIGPFAG